MDSYKKTTWRNGAAPALSAENLNNIEEGIEDVTNEVIDLESKMMSVKDISRSELDSATDPNTIYRVLMPEFGRNANVICVNQGSSFRTQYFFDTYGLVKLRIYTQSTDQWSDFFEIGTGNNIQNGAVFTAKIADKAVTKAKLGDDVIAELAGKGVIVINEETVPESAQWDDEIPYTYVGEYGDVALWNGELWYLSAINEYGAHKTYAWERLLSLLDLEAVENAINAKMDLSPLNPTAEQIAALPSGQLYSDTANHKGVVKGGQEFYDTSVAVRVFENNDGQDPPSQTISNTKIYNRGDYWINLSLQNGERVCTALYICNSVWMSNNSTYQYRWLCLYGTSSEYYTKTEIDQKGYLTLETLPIYDGTVI